MNHELLHGDLCPLYHLPLIQRLEAAVRSKAPYTTRTDTTPHGTSCASDMTRAQKWADLMRARYEG
ncbi:hypothetical protein [Streptomyces sp. NPDC051561]|uniref:hypothetical protein n=1 Tax=Streptomyces sp. NPDC051561 TaxID=3365658 RepID=UPI0037A1B8CB